MKSTLTPPSADGSWNPRSYSAIHSLLYTSPATIDHAEQSLVLIFLLLLRQVYCSESVDMFEENTAEPPLYMFIYGQLSSPVDLDKLSRFYPMDEKFRGYVVKPPHHPMKSSNQLFQKSSVRVLRQNIHYLFPSYNKKAAKECINY